MAYKLYIDKNITSFIIFIRQHFVRFKGKVFFTYSKELQFILKIINRKIITTVTLKSPITNVVVSVENMAHLSLNLISIRLDDRGS